MATKKCTVAEFKPTEIDLKDFLASFKAALKTNEKL